MKALRESLRKTASRRFSFSRNGSSGTRAVSGSDNGPPSSGWKLCSGTTGLTMLPGPTPA